MNNSFQIVHFVTRSDTVGGVHVHIIDIAKRLQANGVNVAILSGNSESQVLQSRLKQLDIPSFTLRRFYDKFSFFNDFVSFFQLISFLKKCI